MSNPKENFHDAIERIIWAHSNLSTTDRAKIVRQFANELEDTDRFEDMDEHIRYRLEEMGYKLPEDGYE